MERFIDILTGIIAVILILLILSFPIAVLLGYIEIFKVLLNVD